MKLQARLAAPRGTAADLVVDRSALAALLGSLAAGCRSEVRWMRCAPDGTSSLEPFLGGQVAGLAAGVSVRALLDSDHGAAKAARLLATRPDRGRTAVRTSPDLPQEVLLVDEAVVLVPRPPRSLDGLCIAVFREPAAIGLARDLFETSWSAAAPPPADRGPEPVAADTASIADDPLKLQILQLLAEGAKDEAICRRTGISLRTCRRHVAAILHALNAASRFQAGVNAVAIGLVSLPAQR
ncbi:helix-turn-helix domain-containing protein [Kitasatospora sp. NPDC058170]|uniref:helix-turn-helix transcriptional regulator n=1 Tax=Kitasatospora sp. NPDC058170 TaxID=3346364 RepID=UPI0036DC61DE